MVAELAPKDRFYWSQGGEPHSQRRREILAKYGDQVRKLYGYDNRTAHQVGLLFPLACIVAVAEHVLTYSRIIIPSPGHFCVLAAHNSSIPCPRHVTCATVFHCLDHWRHLQSKPHVRTARTVPLSRLQKALVQQNPLYCFQHAIGNPHGDQLSQVPSRTPQRHGAQYFGSKNWDKRTCLHTHTHHNQQGVDGIDVDLPTFFEAGLVVGFIPKVLFCTVYLLIYGVRPLVIRPKMAGT